ncbi:DUF1573 domain-containing protein [Ferruginibacter sp.]
MKKCCIIILAVKFIFIGSLYAQTISNSVVFEERIHDFGTIMEKNGKVSHVFTFRNAGKTPVVVTDVFSACGCIGNVITKEPVKPGGKGKVTITFNPEYKSGFFSKELVVYSNDRKEFSRIWVQGKIIPAEHPIEEDYPYNYGNGLYMRLKVMAFGYLKPGETRQMELHYANNTNKPMTLNFLMKDKRTGLVFKNPGTIAAKGKGVMTVAYTMPKESKDDVLFTLYPYVNNKQLSETLQVKILYGK